MPRATQLPATDPIALLAQVRQLMTQRQVSERLSVTPKTIGRWKRRETDQHENGLFDEGPTPGGWTGAARPGSHGNASPEPVGGRKIKDGNFEKLDDWNVVEVIWQGDRSAHIVNGRTVNTVSMLQQPDPAKPGKFIPLTRGKIAIEVEFAEIWYRRIEVRSLA